MQIIKPSICKSEGPISLCDCPDRNIKEEQRKCIAYREGKKGYCAYYRSSIGACSNYDGYFSVVKNR